MYSFKINYRQYEKWHSHLKYFNRSIIYGKNVMLPVITITGPAVFGGELISSSINIKQNESTLYD